MALIFVILYLFGAGPPLPPLMICYFVFLKFSFWAKVFELGVFFKKNILYIVCETC